MAGRMKIVICLLRNDLRYRDNEVLFWAHKNATNVIPLYCFDPRHYKGTHQFGFPKTGPHRLKFLLESVRDLRTTLQSVGSGLVVRSGNPEDVVPQLIQQFGEGEVAAVALQEEATREELDVEAGLHQSCSKLGVNVKKFWGSTLYHREDVPFSPQGVPNVYTEFRKKVENRSHVRPPINMPKPLKGLPEGVEEGDIPVFSSFGLKDPGSDSRTAFPFQGGETTGLARIEDYFWKSDCIAKYKETRNGLIGSEYSTKFAAWLAHGCVSPRQIHAEVKRYEKERTENQSTYWVIFELIWRDYFKFVALKFGDKMFYLSGLLGVHKPWNKNKQWFDAWCKGQTGVPFVDANIREMAATGFMSNRGRQNVASFLTKDLVLDWRLGAEWFEQMLIEKCLRMFVMFNEGYHDVTSNYGNWLSCWSVMILVRTGSLHDQQGLRTRSKSKWEEGAAAGQSRRGSPRRGRNQSGTGLQRQEPGPTGEVNRGGLDFFSLNPSQEVRPLVSLPLCKRRGLGSEECAMCALAEPQEEKTSFSM
eukprot:XP_011669459.1 PREDICTED: cryptochrome DASH [Strongylocentrotus purpuratus]